MEFLDKTSLRESVYKQFLQIYESIKEHFSKSTSHTYVRCESNKNAANTQHLLELIDSEKINNDDYGIVLSITIGFTDNEKMTIKFEILLSYGPIIQSNEFELSSNNNCLYCKTDLMPILEYMNKLPYMLYFVWEQFLSGVDIPAPRFW